MEMRLKAFKAVKTNNGAAGIDGMSIADYEEKLTGNTYKLWNRMTLGSYCPKPVREVAISKKPWGQRVLGTPTVEDRVAQQVVKNYLEPKVDPSFHQDSYGYRPGKNVHQAVTQSLKRRSFIGWVIDLDIKCFFDNLDHELMMKGLKRYTTEKWVLMYVERWLKAGMQKQDGQIISRTSGMPQGGVVSALLANIYLHFALNKWMEIHFPKARFERYCDDIVIHCRSQKQALYLKSKVIGRMGERKLEINEGKTHVVYCKNEQNAERGHQKVSYNFLGYTLRPKLSPTKHGLKLLTAACMSHSSKLDVREDPQNVNPEIPG
ncbi:hypothetical protein GCM10023091_33850 [Ravibacter arvi]|uniref:Reverse transcriptase domain-containing protein n=2 Tax=Ravibacter arvi TaxID=2051041 RepID=A0ABP8M424_9BACT